MDAPRQRQLENLLQSPCWRDDAPEAGAASLMLIACVSSLRCAPTATRCDDGDSLL